LYSYPDFPDLIPYQVTDEPDLEGLTPEAVEFLEEIHPHLQHASAALIVELKSYIKLFPDISIFKSHLMVIYASQGKLRRARKMGELIRKEHPEYLFARINLAGLNIGKKNGDYVRKQLGQELWLHKLRPEEEVFHESEVKAYYNTVAKQLLQENNLKEAIERHKVMIIACPHAEETKKLAILLALQRRIESQKGNFKWEEEADIFEEYYLDSMLSYLTPTKEKFFKPAQETTTIDIPHAPPPPIAPVLGNRQSKISRNAPCPCGSGKKYKFCCMRS
jgi:uncharacterized protein YecA (UPF0149 family)